MIQIQVSGLRGANLWRQVSVDSTLACAAPRRPPHCRSALWQSVHGQVRPSDPIPSSDVCVGCFASTGAATTVTSGFWRKTAALGCGSRLCSQCGQALNADVLRT